MTNDNTRYSVVDQSSYGETILDVVNSYAVLDEGNDVVVLETPQRLIADLVCHALNSIEEVAPDMMLIPLDRRNAPIIDEFGGVDLVDYYSGAVLESHTDSKAFVRNRALSNPVDDAVAIGDLVPPLFK